MTCTNVIRNCFTKYCQTKSVIDTEQHFLKTHTIFIDIIVHKVEKGLNDCLSWQSKSTCGDKERFFYFLSSQYTVCLRKNHRDN